MALRGQCPFGLKNVHLLSRGLRLILKEQGEGQGGIALHFIGPFNLSADDVRVL